MLGMTNENLADGIYNNTKALSGVQHNRSTLHPKNAEQILAKLNLTGDMYSDEVKLNDMTLYDDCFKLTNSLFKNKYDEVDMLLGKIKGRLDLNIKVNRQYVGHKELVLSMRWRQLLSDEEYLEGLKRVLDITLPINRLFSVSDHMFTIKEVVLITIIFCTYSDLGMLSDMNRWKGLLDEHFKNLDNKIIYWEQYAFYKCAEANVMSNHKEYKISNQVATQLIQESCLAANFEYVASFTYIIAWGYRQEIEDNGKKLNLSQHQHYLTLLNQVYILAEILDKPSIIDLIDKDIKSLSEV